MEDNSDLKELMKNSFLGLNYTENPKQVQDISNGQSGENISRQFYGDYSEQNNQSSQSSQSTIEVELNSTEQDNTSNKQPFEQAFNSNTEPIEKYSNIHFFCKKCRQVPKVKFIDTLKISGTCGCSNNFQINITNYLNETIQTIDEKNEQENNILFDVFYCKVHKGSKFLYYCETCQTSLCGNCLRKGSNHKNHSLLIFHYLMNEADKKIEFIKDKFNLNSHHFDNESSNFFYDEENEVKLIKYANFIKFLNALINDYNNFTCNTHFIIISNLYHFLEDLNKNNSNEVQDLELKEEININNMNSLNYLDSRVDNKNFFELL